MGGASHRSRHRGSQSPRTFGSLTDKEVKRLFREAPWLDEALLCLERECRSEFARELGRYFRTWDSVNTCDIEDILQEAIIKVFHAVRTGGVRPGPKNIGWLWIVLRNTRVNFLRKHGRNRQREILTAEFQIEPSTGTDATMEEVLAILKDILDALPARERVVVELRASGMKLQQIANELEMSITWVYNVLKKVKERLQAELGGEIAEEG